MQDETWNLIVGVGVVLIVSAFWGGANEKSRLSLLR